MSKIDQIQTLMVLAEMEQLIGDLKTPMDRLELLLNELDKIMVQDPNLAKNADGQDLF